MTHQFDFNIAKKFGVEEAIIIHNLKFWIDKNKANKKHCYDGEYWTYNSISAFAELFPYWTKRQIERIIASCEKQGAILKGNFNKISYDRTTWYALTNMVKCIYANGEMDLTESVNGNTEMVSPIPDSNTDNKTYIFNHKTCSEESFTNELIPYVKEYGKETIRAFFNYWTEKDNKGKMRVNGENFFEIPKRLATWSKNSFGKTKNNVPASNLLPENPTGQELTDICKEYGIVMPDHILNKMFEYRVEYVRQVLVAKTKGNASNFA